MAAARVASSAPPAGARTILSVNSLTVDFQTEEGVVSALDRVSLELRSGETLGVLGESGSGKTTLALAAMTLLPENATVEGEVRFYGEPIAGPDISGSGVRRLRRAQRKKLSEKFQQLRWQGISMVFQGSMNAFNPVYTIEKQIAETFRLHTPFTEPQIHAKVLESIRRAGLDPRVLKAFPHELSGGMKQRAVVAMALALDPKLVIADEPTTGLDVVTQARLIAELKQLRKSVIGSMIVISHDIGVIAQLADHVAVLYSGRTMEYGTASDIFLHPGNPYTQALIESYPSLAKARAPISGIPGAPPDPIHPPAGCRFAPRCAFVQEVCRATEPPLVEIAPGHTSACHFAKEVLRGAAVRTVGPGEPLPPMETLPAPDDGGSILESSGLTKYFNLRGSASGALFAPSSAKRLVRAVDHVDFDMRRSEILAVVGESGSGKTTLGKTTLRLLDPSGGKLLFRLPPRPPGASDPPGSGRPGSVPAAPKPIDVVRLRPGGIEQRMFRRATQMIFQDPYDSIDPNMRIFDIVSEPLIAHHEDADPDRVLRRVESALATARLAPPSNYLDRYPHELSGGERQRVAAARALVMDPPFLVADEPISMLDVSLRAGFLNLLRRLRSELGTSILYITHDIASARYVADRILVMYLGVGVELGPSEAVIRTPLHPYTKALIQAVPLPTPEWNPGELEILGEIGNAVDVPKGCRFARRCPYRQSQCDTTPPPKQGGSGHWYLCHFTQEELAKIPKARSGPGGPAIPSALHPLNCPSCGAPLTPAADGTVITCQYCGRSFTVGSTTP